MKIWQVTAFAAVFLLILTLSGCRPDDPILPMPPESQMKLEPLPKQMTVDVYWDATVSMRGFTTLAAGNVYRNLPDILDDLGGFFGEVHFFRFGEKVLPVEGREHRRFSEPDTYNEPITSFGNVIDESDPAHLSVVITDLFESDADWSNVTQKLREKYFSKHLLIAIIGIKNSFNGEIYDVGLNAATFSYNSGDDPAKFRPFYLFLTGSEPQVRAFLEQWKKKQIPAAEMQYVVFSEHFSSEVTTLRVADAEDVNKKNLLEDNQLLKADDRLQEVHVANRSEKVELIIPGKCPRNPDTCQFDNNAFENRVKIFAWSNETENQPVNEPKQDKENTDEGFSVGKFIENLFIGDEEDIKPQGHWQLQEDSNDVNVSFTWDGNNCELKLDFMPESTLPLGKIGLVQVQIVPSRQNVKLPDWIALWDMGNIDIAPEKFDGSKTVNLKHIADSLKDSLMVAARPMIAELDLLIDRR